MSDLELLDLILTRTPLVDVRAPVEFAHGTLPGATSLPLLNDDERAQVGLTYKTRGQDAAIALGLEILRGETKADRLDAWASYFKAHPEAVLFCFRGGLRSQSVKNALASERGVHVPLIEGGYKRARGLLLEALEQRAREDDFIVVSGYTGSGKTRLLARVNSACRVCDLERLANHRGSAFGGRAPQPSQIDFENELALRLLELKPAVGAHRSPIVLEDESRAIGARTVPPPLFEKLSTSRIFVVEASLEQRADNLIHDYLTEDFALTPGECDDEKIGQLRAQISRNLNAIERRLGGLERQTLSAMAEAACEEQLRTGHFEVHQAWVARLLERYYDKLYQTHLEREKARVVFRGSFGEVEERLTLLARSAEA